MHLLQTYMLMLAEQSRPLGDEFEDGALTLAI